MKELASHQFKLLIASLGVYLAILLFINPPVFAQNRNPNSDSNDPAGQNVNTINIGNQIVNKNLGIQTNTSPGTILSNAVRIMFIIGGLAVLVFMIWGAFDWITSGGDKEAVASARKKITNSLIGLALLALSAFIVSLVGQIVGFNPLLTPPLPSLGDTPANIQAPAVPATAR